MRKLAAVIGMTVACALVCGSASAQTPRLKQIMRTKLDHAKNLLEAVVTSNWSQMERESRALQQLTNDPAWMVLKMPEYVLEREAFLKAVDSLNGAAKQRDLDEASKGFVALSSSCVSCHQYLARTRVAK